MTTIRCGTCFREELWDGSQRTVVHEGGTRRPAEAAPLAAWRVLRSARDTQIGPIVAVCPACGQPMTASNRDFPAIPWTLVTPKGTLVVDSKIHGPDGELSDAAAEAWLEAQLGAPLVTLGASPVALLMMTPFLAPMGCWLASFFFLVLFFYAAANGFII